MAIADTKTFTLTDEHLTLLRRANVRWGEMEWGAPEIDGKRPYGNGNLKDDVAGILGWELVDAEGGPKLTMAQANRALELHRETETALQIVLATGSFEAGDYEASKYGRDWRRREEA
jgi:hypothetical protein